jgi:hypothetical protein
MRNVFVRRTGTLRALVLSCCLLAPATAGAQTVDPQTTLAAHALYQQALTEMDAKSYVSACRKLEEVTRLSPAGLGAKLKLGECYEALGKIASAWSQYALVEATAAKAGQLDRAQKAAERSSALRPKLAMLTIEVPEDARAVSGLTITRDGVPVGAAEWATPLPIDAGGHEIIATAPFRKPWKTQVEVITDGAKVSVQVKPPEPAPSSPVKPLRTAPSGAPDRAWQRPVAIAAVGLGAAGLAVGAVLGGLAMTKNAESKEDNHCDAQDRCDPTGIELRHQAVGLGNGATAALVAGGILAAGGAVLFVTTPKPSARKEGPGARPSPWSAAVALLPGGVAVRGAW